MSWQNNNDHLFVYGTLRKEINHPMADILQKYSQNSINGWFSGKLFDAGSFPAAVLADENSDRVHGEIYEITNSDALFHHLDPYEGYDAQTPSKSLYLRKKVMVKTNIEEQRPAWTYLYNRSVGNLPYIPGGDYLDYLEKNS